MKFEPSLVEVGPILPFSDIVSTAVTLRNASDRPVEVFSLDFDTDFMARRKGRRKVVPEPEAPAAAPAAAPVAPAAPAADLDLGYEVVDYGDGIKK